MVRVRLSVLLGERKLRIAEVARETGINRGTLTRMYYESAERIELDVLEHLCSYLQCEVGDLLQIERPAEPLTPTAQAGHAAPAAPPGRFAAHARQSPVR